MNYWERYGGDYARDTAHLNLAENGAYGVLLDVQYSTERGLPEGYDAMSRICRASTKLEHAAVRSVADQFFPVGADGLRWNPRARLEIDRAQKRIAASRVNGKCGGRKPGRLPAGSRQDADSNPSATQSGEASPYPNPIPQRKERSAPAKAAVAPPEGVEPENWQAWLRHKGKKQTEDADRLQRKHIVEWRADGVDVNRMVEDAVAGKWQGLHPPDRKPLNGKNGHAGAWWDSEAGILAKGREIDVPPRPGESMPEFKARLNQRINAQRGTR